MKTESAVDIRKEIEELGSLPTIPPVVTKLLRIIDSEDVSLKQIGDFISRDQVLSMRVLKMINSPIYGFPGRISSVSQALMLIGLGAVKGMLLGVSIFDMMQKTMVGLWEHSIGTATAARKIAERAGLKEVEDASVAGLIHDIGKVALGARYPERYAEAIRRAEDAGTYMLEAEKDIFGVTHAQAGSWLAQKWNFPANLVEAIGYHHKPRLAKESPLIAATVHLADTVVKMMAFGFSGDPYVHVLDRDAWERLGLDMEDVRAVLSEMEEALAQKDAFVF